MGWTVRGECSIEIFEGATLPIGTIEEIVKIIKDSYMWGDNSSELSTLPDAISWVWWGNKRIADENLVKIKDMLKGLGYKFSIVCNEYHESGDGYYYNTEDDDES